MGKSCSKDDAKNQARTQSNLLDLELKESAQKQSKVYQILFLDHVWQSGLPSVLTELSSLYDDRKLLEEERKCYKEPILSSIRATIRTLSQRGHDPAVVDSKEVVLEAKEDEKGISEEIKRLGERRKNIASPESMWFVDRIEEIQKASYIPSQMDILNWEMNGKTGIYESQFKLDGLIFRIIAPKQRNERKKWMHCFESVSAVSFVVSLTSYDQTPYGDSRNELQEALDLFEDVCNSKWIPKYTYVILVFNNLGKFQEKIQRVPLRTHFPEYKGEDGDYEASCSFIHDMFARRVRNEKNVHTYSLREESMRYVFPSVRDLVCRYFTPVEALLD